MIRRLGTIANRKKVAARIDFLFLGSRDGFRDCAIGGMNIDVTLWAKWHGCGAGRSELGCSAGWTLGWVDGGWQHGMTRRGKSISGITLWLYLPEPHACPYPALLEECVAFSAACDAAHCFANPARCLDPPIASDKHGFEVGVPFCVVFCPITSHDQKCC